MDELRNNAAEVVNLLRVSLQSLEEKISAAELQTIDDIDTRFQIWCAELGVFEHDYGSLDWRLPPQSKARRSADILIRHLKDDLTCDILLEKRRPYEDELDVGADTDSEFDDNESDGEHYKELDVRFENLQQTMSNLEKLYLLIKEEPLACPWRSYSHYLDSWYEFKASKDCCNAGCELVDDDALFLRLKRASIERTKRVAVWLKSTRMTSGRTPLEHLGKARLQDNGSRSDTGVLDACPDASEASQPTGGFAKDIMHELRPYLCTYDDCITENEQYASRSEWLAHEKHVHSTPVWKCRDHLDVAVSSENEFKNHLIIDHPDLKPVHIDMLSLHSKRSSSDSRNRCPLCLLYVKNLEDGTKIKDHIAEHLENIASSSLPLRSIAEQRSTSQLAIKLWSAPMVEMLLLFGAHIYLLEQPCLEALQAASSAGHMEFVQALCDVGADVLVLDRMVEILHGVQSKKKLLADWLQREKTERRRQEEVQKEIRAKQQMAMNEEEQKREPREMKTEDTRTDQMRKQISASLRTEQAEEAERKARVRAGQAAARQRNAEVEQRLAAERRLQQEQHERDLREERERERLRQERERREMERLQRERLQRERLQRERLQRERQERERLEREGEERKRLQRERQERESSERERVGRERLERERLERERLERERLERERLERERLERERLERERQERVRQTREREIREREIRVREEQQALEREQRRQREDARRLVQARSQDTSRNVVPTHLRTGNVAPTHLRTGSGPIAVAVAQPPWQFSQTLGGEFVYHRPTDSIFLRHGRAFVRPQHMARDALESAAWDGPLPIVPHAGSTVPPYGRHGAVNVGRHEVSHSMYQAAPHVAMGRQIARQQQGEVPAAMASSLPAGVQSGSQADRHPGQMISAQGEVQVFFQNTTQGQSSHEGIVPPSTRERGINVGAESLASTLFPDFTIRPQPSRFFAVGRVFRVLCSEPAAGASIVTSWEPGVVINHRGERAFSKVRRFVVIRTGTSYCTALPINTYGGEGVARRGVNKSQHVIVFSRGHVPPSPARNEQPGRGEGGMQPVPIRIDPDSLVEHLDIMSRLNLAGVTTVSYDVKVRSVGVVNARSMRSLIDQFAVVWGSQPLPVLSSVALPGATSDFAGGNEQGSYEDPDDSGQAEDDDGDGDDNEDEDDEDDEDSD